MRASESRAPFVLLSSLTFGSASSTARPTLVHNSSATPTNSYTRSTNSGRVNCVHRSFIPKRCPLASLNCSSMPIRRS